MWRNKLVFAAIFAFFAGLQGLQAQPFTGNGLRFMQVLNRISSAYVDSIDTEKLEEEAIVYMLKQLDPHSRFIKKEDADQQQERLDGVYVGIGIFYTVIRDSLTVLKPIDQSPAWKAGLKVGDRIVEIAGQPTVGSSATVKNARELIMGASGSVLEMKVARRGILRPFKLLVVRDQLQDRSIDAAYMIAPEIGYVRINRFAATTNDEFVNALYALKNQNATKLIIDLRDNGGGYLNAAVQLAGHFLENGQTIVYTEGQHRTRRSYVAETDSLFNTGHIAVLINESTASASEIFAGAIQDWDRGIVLGRRSFGKGLVQNTFSLYKGDVVRLTISRYFTPSGRLIQKPYDKGDEEYSRDLINRFNKGELSNADSIHFPDSLKYQTIVNKRTVYAGGGIMPDVFVALDTTYFPEYYKKIMLSGELNEEICSYFVDNYTSLCEKYPEFDFFDKNFAIPAEFITHLKKISGVEHPAVSAKQAEQVTAHIKASIAREMWGVAEYYKHINHFDETVHAAISVLDDNAIYQKKLTAEK